MAELEIGKGLKVFFIKGNVEHFEQNANATIGEDDNKVKGYNVYIDETLFVHKSQNAYSNHELSH